MLPAQVEEAGKKSDEALAILQNENTDEAPVVAAEDDTTLPETDELEALQHKFDVLKGKYDKEVGKVGNALESENRQLRETISKLSLQVTDLTTVTTDLEGKLRETPATQNPLSEEEMEVLRGEGLDGPVLAVIQKLIDSKITTSTAPLQNRMASTEQNMQTQRADTFEDRVMATIKSETGLTYQKINAAPEFHEWLSGIIPYTGGTTRRQAGETASKNGNAETFCLLYTDFVEETGFGKRKKPKPNPLEKEIEPTLTDDDSPAPSYQPGRVYTKSDVKKFYDDFTKGRYHNNEAEWHKIDKDIMAAYAEKGQPRIKNI